MPTVSVIVPNYNHARFLPKRIQSILGQTFQDFELILLDDCSTDDSRSILLSYSGEPRVRIEFNDVNSGNTFKQWNKGIRLARGEYVWIAESDDYASERLLKKLVNVLDTERNTAFVYCRSWIVSADNVLDRYADLYLHRVDRKRWTEDFCANGIEECKNYFVYGNPVSNASAVVFRKAIYDEIGGADERLRLCADWKLWASMAMKGTVAYVAEPLNYFRCHDYSVRNSSARMSTDVGEYLDVMCWLSNQTPPTKAAARKARQFIAKMWVPAVMSLRVPVSVKRSILRSVNELDPHPLRNAVRPALNTIWLKFLRHWHAFALGIHSNKL